MKLSAAAFGLFGEDANLRHQVVMDLALDFHCGFDVDLAGVRAEVRDLDLFEQSLCRLRFGESYPDGTPKPAPHLLGEERTQFRAPIPPRERRGVGFVIHGRRWLRPEGRRRLVSVLHDDESRSACARAGIASCRLQ